MSQKARLHAHGIPFSMDKCEHVPHISDQISWHYSFSLPLLCYLGCLKMQLLTNGRGKQLATVSSVSFGDKSRAEGLNSEILLLPLLSKNGSLFTYSVTPTIMGPHFSAIASPQEHIIRSLCSTFHHSQLMTTWSNKVLKLNNWRLLGHLFLLSA